MKFHGSYGFGIQEDIRGIYVEFVQADSAAQNAGLCAGDRLKEINGAVVKGEIIIALFDAEIGNNFRKFLTSSHQKNVCGFHM